MKKTFLLIAALIIGATSANAQRFISSDLSAIKNKKVANKDAKINKDLKKKTISLTKDFNYGDPIMTVDFSTATPNYSFSTLQGHTAGDLQGKFCRLDSASFVNIVHTSYSEWVGYYFDHYNGYSFYSNRLGEKMRNGFAMVSPADKWASDGGEGSVNTLAYNTSINCTDGFSTLGLNTVDVKFNQTLKRFNKERYFIDYSTDPTFTIFDSIEFNVNGIELNSNDWEWGEKRVTLPVRSSVEKPILYIRLRFMCKTPTGADTQQPSGYFWFVDEINVYDGPAKRIDVLGTYHDFATYHIVPTEMQMDTVTYYANIENTGGDTLFDAFAEEKYHTVDFDQTPNLYTFINQTSIGGASDLTTATRIDTGWTTTAHTVIDALNIRRNVYFTAYSGRLQNPNVGDYAISGGIKYLETSGGTNYTLFPMEDTVIYRVVAMPATTETTSSALWASDYGALIEGNSWQYGDIGDFITAQSADAYVAGYEVCNRFITPDDLDTGFYAKGVEVVPANDSCQSSGNIKIRGYLKYWNSAAASVNDYLAPVLVNSQQVLSEDHTIQASDLNNGIFTDNSNSTESTWEYNSIFMPFTQAGVKLLPGTNYYACYKLMDDGKFLVGTDRSASSFGFKPRSSYSKIVYTPGQENSFDASWGSLFGGSASDYSSPMIRLRISKNPISLSSLNDISTPAFNLNAYPNPAQNEATIEYTLNTNGNVVITLTDIMGRNVLTMNKGNQGANTTYRVALNTNNLNNGTYFYTLNVNGVKQTKKLVINK